MLTRDGDERQVLWHNSPVITDGALLGTLSVGVDITLQKRMEKKLAESERTLREAQNVAHIGSWLLDYEHGELHWSAEIYRILDLDPLFYAPSKQVFLELLHPDDLDEVKRAYKMALRTRRPYEVRHRLRMVDGSLKYVLQRAEIAFAAGGTPLRAVGTLQDVTMAVLQELAFQESEERFRTIADFTYDWEYWQGNDREILYISPSCQRITGYTQSDFIRDPALLIDIVHPDDKARFKRHLAEVADSSGEHQLDFRIVTKAKQVRWIAHGCRAVIKDGRPNGRRVSNRDITDLKEAEQLAQKLAYFDALTGLPNRRMLTDRLGQALAAARRECRPLALMFVDLDRFKYINDRFGHDVGDRLLVEVAARIAGCVRASDTAARTGGDEFIALLPEIKQPSNAERIAGKILAALGPPVECDGHIFEISASIGVSLFDPQGAYDGTELMKQADIAMYAAKQAGRNGYRIYDDSLG
jgi:diguanylate cyclase (GGDEF)-like protein/PAS domain S-box-containing protein